MRFISKNLPLVGLKLSDIRWVSLISADVQQRSPTRFPTNGSISNPPSPLPPPAESTGCVVNMTINVEIGCVPTLLPGSGSLAAALSSAFSLRAYESNGQIPYSRRLLLANPVDSLAAAIQTSGCGCLDVKPSSQTLPALGLIAQKSV